MLPPRQQDALDEFHSQLKMRRRWSLQTLSVLILMASTAFPGLILSGFMAGHDRLSTPVLLAIASVGGGLAGAIFYPDFRYWYVGTLCGGIVGVCCLLATYLYLLPRDSILDVEVIIPLFLGALPGFLLYYILMRTLVVARAAAEERAAAHDDADWNDRYRPDRPTSL